MMFVITEITFFTFSTLWVLHSKEDVSHSLYKKDKAKHQRTAHLLSTMQMKETGLFQKT